MDGYLTKPFRREELLEALRPFVGELGRDEAPGPPAAESAAPERAVVDRRALDAIRALSTERGATIVARVIDAYLESAPDAFDALRLAVSEKDAAAVEAQAHGLKSSSANVGARELAELAREAEALGRAGQAAEAAAIVERIGMELLRVREALIAERGRGTA
jgi:HPt (histidine-containing phosphotransfer) domain-containing protein